MKIFNDTTVVGLFDNDKDVEEAIANLQERGFGESDEDEMQIIDENRLAQETPVDASGKKAVVQPDQGIAPGGPAVPYEPVSEAGSEAAMIENSAFDALTRLGLGHEEASFHARHVARGNSLVIVDTTEERAPAALEILQKTGSRVSAA